MSVTEASRHLDRTLAELAAEYGELDVIREPREVEPDDYDSLRDRAASLGGCGGAGAWIRNSNGAVLLVRSDDGWCEPGGTRRPGGDYLTCARRAVRDQTGLDARLTDVRHVHVRYCYDWTERDPIPQPFVVFDGDASGEPTASAELHAAAWRETLPSQDELLYDLLRELPLDGR